MKFTNQSSRFDKNIKRIFTLVPLIYNNQGIEIKKIVSLIGYKNELELQDDLDRLLMFGIPPYSPSDFISLSIEEGKVFLDFPHGLEQPLDLSSSEWLVLQKVIQSERDFQTVDSLNTEISNDLLKKISSIPLLVWDADKNTQKRIFLKEALEDRLQIQFLYSSLASKEPELRRIDPWVFFEHKNLGYVMGFCHTRRQARSFLLDRLMDIELLDQEIETQCPQNITEMISKTAIFNSTPNGFQVKLAFERNLKNHLELILDFKNVQPLNDTSSNLFKCKNWLEGTTKISSSHWFLDVMKGLGTSVAILEPDFLKEKICISLNEMSVPALLNDGS